MSSEIKQSNKKFPLLLVLSLSIELKLSITFTSDVNLLATDKKSNGDDVWEETKRDSQGLSCVCVCVSKSFTRYGAERTRRYHT